AGFFEARNWRLNLRPAMAQVIHAAVAAGTPLTLADLPTAFERRWKGTGAQSEKDYIKTFLPPSIAWLRTYEHLLRENVLAEGNNLLMFMRRGLTWAMLGEFGQDAHVGRTLPRTRTAALQLVNDAMRADAALQATTLLREKVDALRAVTEDETACFLDGLI